MKSPIPHETPMGISGPIEGVDPLIASLQFGVGDSYDIVALRDASAARQVVADQDVSAVLVPGAALEEREEGRARWNATTHSQQLQENAAVIYIASAASPVLATAGTVPLQNVAARPGLPVTVRDVVPLDSSDLAGNGPMWPTLAVTLSACVGVTMVSNTVKDLLRLRMQAVAVPVFDVVVGLLSSLLLSLVFDSLSGSHQPSLPTLIDVVRYVAK